MILRGAFILTVQMSAALRGKMKLANATSVLGSSFERHVGEFPSGKDPAGSSGVWQVSRIHGRVQGCDRRDRGLALKLVGAIQSASARPARASPRPEDRL